VSWLLRVSVPSDLLESIAGDLEEVRDRRGTAAASRAAARIAASFAWERLTRERHLPPVADEAPQRAGLIDTVRQDAAFGVRLLRRQPGFAFVAVLALALGIGANTAIFSVVDAVLWRPLPFAGAGSIVSLAEQRPREGRVHGPVSPADFYDWRRTASSFSDMAAYYPKAANLTGGGEPQRIDGLRVTDGFLRVLAMQPALGRDLRAEEDADGRNRVILLSDGLWRRAFGADPSVVGRRVQLDGEPYEIVGVLPAAFWWPGDPAFLTPLALDAHDRTLRGAHFLSVVGRLRSGVSAAQAREELAVIGRRLSAQYPAENTDHAPELRPIRTALVGDTRTALLVLLGAVAFVLLIACGNVAMLLLARALGRHRELSVRFAMGASRGRIVRQLLVESLVLSFAGGAAGLLVGHWALSGLRAILPAQFEQLPGIAAVGLDARVLAWAAGVSLASGVAFGIAPALAASDRRIGRALTEEARGAAGHARGTRIRSTLVAAELALSVVLLAGAVLLMVSFRNLMDVAPGFRPDRIFTARLTLPYSRYGTHARVTAFYAALFERLRTTPGIASAAVSSAPPFSGIDDALDLQIERRPLTPAAPPRAYPRLVSAGYFATMGIPLERGRVFDAHDDGTGRAVAAINQTAQRRYWPNGNPIGTRIRLGDGEWMTIVGIVGDVHHGGLDAELEPEAYIPLAQGFDQFGTAYERSLTLLVRADPNGSNPSALLRQAVAAVDPQQPLGVIRPMDAWIAQSVAAYRLNLTLLGAFALVAVVLTGAGLYGVMAYLAGQRTREMGVRMALGATAGQVAALMLGEAGLMMAAGIATGIVAALALTRAMTSLLFGVSAADPIVYAGVAASLLAVGLAAVAVPCRRVASLDPVAALRHD
jgi:putative ABC transport system permease protein